MLSRVARTVSRRAAVTTVAKRSAQNGNLLRSQVVVSQLGARQLATSANGGDDDADTHSDFKPKYHAAATSDKDDILKMIDSHVNTYPILLYMKGTPSAPQCGFSMQVVRILHNQGVSFDSVNVLDHPEIREGIKEYSEWPTIPQLYVNGEFVGGCDILTDMHKSGELAEILAEVKQE